MVWRMLHLLPAFSASHMPTESLPEYERTAQSVGERGHVSKILLLLALRVSMQDYLVVDVLALRHLVVHESVQVTLIEHIQRLVVESHCGLAPGNSPHGVWPPCKETHLVRLCYYSLPVYLNRPFVLRAEAHQNRLALSCRVSSPTCRRGYPHRRSPPAASRHSLARTAPGLLTAGGDPAFTLAETCTRREVETGAHP